MEHYQVGNTIRLSADFEDWAGALKDPSIVKVIIYDNKYTILDEYTLGTNNKVGAGKYFFDYTPRAVGEYIYEWYAELDGTSSISRNKIRVKMT